MLHYTSFNQDAFIGSVTSDFVAQIAQRLEKSDMSQSEFAQKLGVSESEVSQVLNLNRINLTIKKMTRFARAVGMKIAVVAYDDHDPNNEHGPVGSEIFTAAWERFGRPRNLFIFSDMQNRCIVSHTFQPPWAWWNSTSADSHSTVMQLPGFMYKMTQEMTQEATAANARI
jgi:predicted XRE-type DNA-binding protein